MNATDHADHSVLAHSDEDTPVTEESRFAVRWTRAARLIRLPERMLLNRARSEGEAHRRSESAAELEPFRD